MTLTRTPAARASAAMARACPVRRRATHSTAPARSVTAVAVAVDLDPRVGRQPAQGRLRPLGDHGDLGPGREQA